MKRKLLKWCLGTFICASLSLSMVSCNDKDDTKTDKQEQTDDKTQGLVISNSNLTFSKIGGVENITVDANSNVVVMGKQDWVHIKQVGQENGKVKFEIEIPAADASGDRSCQLTFAADGKEAKLSIYQSCDDKIELSKDSESLSAQGGEVSFTVDTKLDYTVTAKSKWLTQSASDGNVYTFTVGANNGYSKRTGRIEVVAGSSTKTFYVYQEEGQKLVVTSSMSATELSKYMYPAWNLGNTMEATGGETGWQKTKTSQEVIDFVAECGFRAVRIPCSWMTHRVNSADGFKIDQKWIDRVKEVVQYCINANMFVELNDHYDGGWIEELGFSKTATYTEVDEEWIAKKEADLKALWTIIAEEFKDFDNHLMLAGMNEPFQQYNLFHDKHEKLTPILERYNQAFVDAVRATGGNNANRILVVQGPSVNISSTLKYFHTPTDIVDGKLMVEVHHYEPWNFCGEEKNPVYTWNQESYIKGQMEDLKKAFCDKGFPVLIGEYAAQWRDYKDQEKHDASVKAYYKAISKYAPSNGCLPFTWDINYCPDKRGVSGTMCVINRANLTIYNQPAYEGIMEGTEEAVWPY